MSIYQQFNLAQFQKKLQSFQVDSTQHNNSSYSICGLNSNVNLIFHDALITSHSKVKQNTISFNILTRICSAGVRRWHTKVSAQPRETLLGYFIFIYRLITLYLELYQHIFENIFLTHRATFECRNKIPSFPLVAKPPISKSIFIRAAVSSSWSSGVNNAFCKQRFVHAKTSNALTVLFVCISLNLKNQFFHSFHFLCLFHEEEKKRRSKPS